MFFKDAVEDGWLAVEDGWFGGINLKAVFKSKYAVVVVIAAVSTGVYLNTLPGGFVHDDVSQVLNNPWIRDVRYIPQIFFTDVWSFLGDKHSNYYRPLMHMIFMVNYHVFGLKPWGFHLVNVLLNAAVSVTVFMVAAALFEQTTPSTAGEKRKGLLLPFMAALLFSTHPVHTEAVAWVSGAPELLFTLFYLLSFYFYVKDKGGQGKNMVLSLVLFLLSALSKEPALTLPFILFIYDYCNPTPAKGERGFKKYIPYLVMAALYFIFRVYALGGVSPLRRHAGLSGYGYFINIFPLFAQYLGKLLWPMNLNAFYVFHPISSVFEWRGTVSVSITLAFILFAYLLRRTNRTALFGLLLIAVPLLPVLYIPALGENTFAERYLYLPSAGFAILTAMILERVYRTKAFGRALAPAAIAVLIVITGLYSAGAVTRNPVWKDSYTMWSDTIKKSPYAATPRNNLGIVLAMEGRLDEAIEEFQTAVRLKPDLAEGHTGLGLAYYQKGRLDRAIEEYEIALGIRPDNAEGHYNLGVAFEDSAVPDKAAEHYRLALRLRPDYIEARHNLGTAYAKAGRPSEAIEEFQRVLALDAGHAIARANLAEAHYDLGNIYYREGRLDEAVKEFKTALVLKPGHAGALKRLEGIGARGKRRS
ncbi:MAG: tetratricopeptide repeat protein [Deltaproteobacteria bacterium]|nr:tetratricopeptide repeat protein [Deltaproteobacteria bacterium]